MAMHPLDTTRRLLVGMLLTFQAVFWTLALGWAAPPASSFAPPASVSLDAETLRNIEARLESLQKQIGKLKTKGVRDPALADIEIFHKAGRWIVDHKEFYDKKSPQWTLAVLDEGMLRASQQKRGEAPWLMQRGQTSIRAYRSRVDDSVQPYAITLPADYGKDPKRKWRLDVVLHGRNRKLTEVSFIQKHDGKKAPEDQDWVQLDVYGRGNLAYRWAGETDVYEAISHFLAVERALRRGKLIDLDRVVLRGFSMGGAGTWHLGLHRPDQWCVLGPGAGFTTTHGYVNGMPARLPPHQEACLRIYDAVDYTENLFNVPAVAYHGTKDKQKQAALNIQKRVAELKWLPANQLTLLEAPGLAHSFPPEWQKKAQKLYARSVKRGRETSPDRVGFVTYTMNYPRCEWVEIMGMEQHYRKATVDARKNLDGFQVTTSNVRALHLGLWPGATREKLTIEIDGQRLEDRPYLAGPRSLHFYLEKRAGKWGVVLPQHLVISQLRQPKKVTDLQGPIDDAFTNGFLCVVGSGDPWHANTQRHADASLERFRKEWSRYLRGKLPVKKDEEVTQQDIASKHLILFGDPSSNSLIRHALPGLPIRWTQETITWQGKKYPARSHVPAMIYPSPLATNSYVVLNTGHTFHARDFRGTNALLYPRWGDHALLELSEENPLEAKVVQAGLFDDYWRWTK